MAKAGALPWPTTIPTRRGRPPFRGWPLADSTLKFEEKIETKDENENGYEKLNELIGVGGSELSPQSCQVAKNALMRFLQENRGTLHSTYAISNGAEESKGK